MSSNLSKLIYSLLDTVTYGYEPTRTAGLKSIEDAINNLTQKILEKALKYAHFYHRNTITVKDINYALRELCFPPLLGLSNLSEDLKTRPYNLIAPSGKSVNIGDVIRKYLLDPQPYELFFFSFWLAVDGMIPKSAENLTAQEIYNLTQNSDNQIDSKTMTESFPSFNSEIILSVEVKKMFQTLTKKLFSKDKEAREAPNTTLQKEQLSDLMPSLLQFFQNSLLKKNDQNNIYILEAIFSLSINTITNLEPYLHVLIQLTSVFLLGDGFKEEEQELAAKTLNNLITNFSLIHPNLNYVICNKILEFCNDQNLYGILTFFTFQSSEYLKEFILPKLDVFAETENPKIIFLMNEILQKILQDYRKFLTVHRDDKLYSYDGSCEIDEVYLGDFHLGRYLRKFKVENI